MGNKTLYSNQTFLEGKKQGGIRVNEEELNGLVKEVRRKWYFIQPTKKSGYIDEYSISTQSLREREVGVQCQTPCPRTGW